MNFPKFLRAPFFTECLLAFASKQKNWISAYYILITAEEKKTGI